MIAMRRSTDRIGLRGGINMWKCADNPPDTMPGLWSKDVVVITNYGDVFSLAYFGDKETGVWQRPARLNKGEKVEWWIDKPEGY